MFWGLTNLSHERVREVETKLNNRARKRYNYETPIFVMEQLFFMLIRLFAGC
jgi:IS30 family transposase